MSTNYIKQAAESLSRIKNISFETAWEIIMNVCINYSDELESMSAARGEWN